MCVGVESIYVLNDTPRRVTRVTILFPLIFQFLIS